MAHHHNHHNHHHHSQDASLLGGTNVPGEIPNNMTNDELAKHLIKELKNSVGISWLYTFTIYLSFMLLIVSVALLSVLAERATTLIRQTDDMIELGTMMQLFILNTTQGL